MARISATSGSSSGDTSAKEDSSTPNPQPDAKRKVDWDRVDRDDSFDGFTVKAVNLRTPKKQKTGALASIGNANYQHASTHATVAQNSPYLEAELSVVHCKVEPADLWESTKRYRKFNLAGEQFEVNQTIFVKKAEDDDNTSATVSTWLARILEVRAGDATHVYLRVYWAYRPEDLPGGRQPYHGDGELIVSNHMDIIEARSVDCVADVNHWDDDPESDWPARDQLYWRQSLDINKPKGKQLSKLRTYCVDKAPCNPDEPLVYCPSCTKWLHAHCLEKQAVKDAYKKYNVRPPKGSKGKSPKRTEEAPSTPPPFIAKLTTSPSGKTRITVTNNLQGQNLQYDVDVQCLACNHTIEKADVDEEPQQSVPRNPITPDESDQSEEGSVIVIPAIANPVIPTMANPVTPANNRAENESTSSDDSDSGSSSE